MLWLHHRIQQSLFGLVAFTFGCLSCGDCVETPSLGSITPANIAAGSPPITLTVNGDHFQRNSTVEWNGVAVSTVFISGTELQATVTAAQLASPVKATVTVFSPPQSQPVTFGSGTTSTSTSSVRMDCVGGTSNSLNFAVNP